MLSGIQPKKNNRQMQIVIPLFNAIIYRPWEIQFLTKRNAFADQEKNIFWPREIQLTFYQIGLDVPLSECPHQFWEGRNFPSFSRFPSILSILVIVFVYILYCIYICPLFAPILSGEKIFPLFHTFPRCNLLFTYCHSLKEVVDFLSNTQ